MCPERHLSLRITAVINGFSKLRGRKINWKKKKSAACKLTELRIPSLTHRQASKKGQNSQNTNPRLSTVLSHLQTFMVSQKHILFRKMMGFFFLYYFTRNSVCCLSYAEKTIWTSWSIFHHSQQEPYFISCFFSFFLSFPPCSCSRGQETPAVNSCPAF